MIENFILVEGIYFECVCGFSLGQGISNTQVFVNKFGFILQ